MSAITRRSKAEQGESPLKLRDFIDHICLGKDPDFFVCFCDMIFPFLFADTSYLISICFVFLWDSIEAFSLNGKWLLDVVMFCCSNKMKFEIGRDCFRTKGPVI